MFGRRVLLLLLITFLSLKVRAEVFTVTSNADSGPGTLREALTLAAANGNAETDFIYFNLPDVTAAGRTITILNSLPIVNSDVVIDASTQPGAVFSANGTKVTIIGSNNQAESLICFLTQNIGRFELYGVVIKNFYTAENDYSYYNGGAVSIQGNAGHIIIGAPGKGNVLYNNGTNLSGQYNYDPHLVNQLEIKANYIGFKENGTEVQAKGLPPIQFSYAYNVTIGGDTRAEGNVIYGSIIVDPGLQSDVLKQDVTIKLKNNIIGANALEAKDPVREAIEATGIPYYIGFSVDANINYPVNAKIDVTDNILGQQVSVNGFKNLTLTIQRNFFGTSSNKANALTMGGAIFLRWLQGTILVGGDDVLQGNTFANAAKGAQAVRFGDAVVNVESSNTVELSHNSFYCNDGFPFLYQYTGPYNKPIEVTVDDLTATQVNGTTKPNARVELFYTDKECTQCQPKTYINSTTADATGKWVYNAPLNAGYGVMASATLNHVSSEFNDTRIYNMGDLKITHVVCDEPGKIEGLVVVNYKTLEWVNSNNEVVGTGLNLNNAPVGKYRLKASQFGCVIYSPEYEIFDLSPHVIDDYKVITQPGCSQGGSIEHLMPVFTDSFAWLDEKGNTITTSSIDLHDLPAGTYTLQLKGTNGCIRTYTVSLKNSTAVNIDESTLTTSPSNCNSPTGGIKGLHATGGSGILQYSWRNAQDQEVGTLPELTGAYAGKYRLRVNDATGCPPVYSSEIEILENNGVSLDLSKQGGISPSCDRTDGSITGLKAPGATTYEWTITNTTTNVGHNLNLTGVPAGFYTLTISNATCSRSYPFEIAGFPPTTFTGITYTKTKSCESYGTGTITLNTINANEEPFQYLWFDEQGNTVGYNKDIQDLKAGNYHLQLINKNYCPYNYPGVFTIEAYPKLEIQKYGTATDATCGVGTGSITATEFKGGSSNYTYQWLDENGTPLPGETNNFIKNLAPGKYTLHLTDGTCIPGDVTYTVKDVAAIPPTPSADDVRVYNPGRAIIKINNPFSTAIYRLYETATSAQPIKDTIGGDISVNVTESRSYYVSLTYGYCESARTEVKLFLSALTGDIINTFTPNGDGVNDYWVIKGLDTYPDATVKIFNRYGNSIFESVGYARPFDGNRNGKPLPAGVYYYIINLKRGDVLSGNVTIIR
jgi:gliding motility-associated-like protein